MRAQSHKLKWIGDAKVTARSYADVLERRCLRSGRRREQQRGRAGKGGTDRLLKRLRTVTRRERETRRDRGDPPCLIRLGTWRAAEVERGGELGSERLELSLLRELNLLRVVQEGAPSLLQNRRFLCTLRRTAIVSTDGPRGSVACETLFGSHRSLRWLRTRCGTLTAVAWTFGGALLWSAS